MHLLKGSCRRALFGVVTVSSSWSCSMQDLRLKMKWAGVNNSSARWGAKTFALWLCFRGWFYVPGASAFHFAAWATAAVLTGSAGESTAARLVWVGVAGRSQAEALPRAKPGQLSQVCVRWHFRQVRRWSMELLHPHCACWGGCCFSCTK